LTWGAVLHGPPSSPCVAAWDAASISAPGSPQVTAVLSGDLAHAWLFRLGSAETPAPPPRTGAPGATPTPAAPRAQSDLKIVEHRPMTCRFDPSAKVPDAVWNA